jgi:exportin-T
LKKGEDEAMFMEYRKNMKHVLDSIAALEPNIVLTTIKNLVLDTAKSWQTKSFYEIENALYLLFLITEAVPVILKF